VSSAILIGLLVVAVVAVGFLSFFRRRNTELEDAESEARRWVERLGGQVLNLQGTDEASKQAMADASERYNAASAQLDRARSPAQYRQVIQTAYEGLYYVRAARLAMNLDPGPELPPLPGQQRAGAVTQDRDVEVEGQRYSASPGPSARNSHYYPGGMVAGRPVPAGWYSSPWWKTALVAGAWGVGSFLLFDALFSGMEGNAYMNGFEDAQALDAANGFDGYGDYGGGDYAGGDYGAPGDQMVDDPGDWGGGDFGDLGGGFGDFGGGFGGGGDDWV
jgi:hypothetical protein